MSRAELKNNGKQESHVTTSCSFSARIAGSHPLTMSCHDATRSHDGREQGCQPEGRALRRCFVSTSGDYRAPHGGRMRGTEHVGAGVRRYCRQRLYDSGTTVQLWTTWRSRRRWVS